MSWEEFRKLTGNEDTDILDYIAVQEILRLHATGLSYKRIAIIVESDEDYILDTIISFLDASPFKDDLDFNPLFIYESSSNYDEFRSKCKISPVTSEYDISNSWDSCRVYLRLAKTVEEYYAKN